MNLRGRQVEITDPLCPFYNNLDEDAVHLFFNCSKIEYLGHIVLGEGVAMDATKVQAVLEWPTPLNIKQLRGFLGLTGYYRRFINGYAKLVAPLTYLLKKEAFKWTPEAETTFVQL
ncbi:uncharacterized mitochondrial protein AtMg00860-like [Glycine max]|uniref:uncharacterized mitochondrial protein AtMg00860-like n=1 Tax=Glycine max TaxID=3847 RepID=UPI0003DE8E61|nr:uncharacterized mitochondrial protein AtMg00860-like [Glycine max]|eukprot:XP_006579092.1 uncharacterized protein LOC102670236 [Glycine max]